MNVEEELNKLIQWKAKMEGVARPLPGVLHVPGGLMLGEKPVDAVMTDYSALSTIVGWSAFTVKQINYMRVGRLVFVQFFLSGTSDSTDASFTPPFAPTMRIVVANRSQDNGGTPGAGLTWRQSGSAIELFPTVTGGSWTASGTKEAAGQFWYVM